MREYIVPIYDDITDYDEICVGYIRKYSTEIVRCKDCRYAHMSTDGSAKYCEVWFPDEAEYLDGDNYCSFGERRNNEID